MEIIAQIERFSIRDTQSFVKRNLSIPSEVKFPPRAPRQQVYFLNPENEICIDLIRFFAPNELQEFKIIEGELLERDYLNELSVKFSFDLIRHPLASTLLIGVLPRINKDYGNTIYGVIKRNRNQRFFMIFAKRGSTIFEEDIVYVHGIWQVSLPTNMEVKLFNGKAPL